MSEAKTLVAGIVKYLRGQLDSLSSDARESVEVSVQCLEAAYGVTAEDATLDLADLLEARRPAPDAERLKNEGNDLMKADKYSQALQNYSRAIAMEPGNAVYFCNRAAAYFKLGQHEAAVADCAAALALRPDYGKAHGRMGLALAALDRHREARVSFFRAAQLEPDNASYRENERLAAERAARQPPSDVAGLLQSPGLMGMATEMLADPQMQSMISGLVAGRGLEPGGGGVAALLQAGQALARQMQAANPQLVEQLRQQVQGEEPAPPQDKPPQA